MVERATSIRLFSLATAPMRVFHLTWIVFLVCFFAWFAVAPLMPLIRDDLGLTKDQIANINIAAVLVTVFARLAIGPMCDRYGARRTYTWLLAFGAIPVFGIALAQTYEAFLFFRLLIGAIGASFVITQYHTSVMFAPNVVGTANATVAGWGNAGGGVAQAVMPLIVAALLSFGIEQAMGWRVALFVPGIMMLAAAVLYSRFAVDTPSGNLPTRASAPSRAAGTGLFFAAARNYRVWLLFVAYAACFGVELTIHGIAAIYYVDRFGLDLKTAGLYAGSFGLLALFARPLGGFLSDRIALRHALDGRTVLLCGVLLGEAAGLVLFAEMDTAGAALFAMLAFGLFTHVACGATFSLVPFIDRKTLGGVAGIVGAGGNVGAVLAGFLMKGVETAQAGIFAMGCVVAVCAVFTLSIRFSREHKESERRLLDAALAARAVADVVIEARSAESTPRNERVNGKERLVVIGNGMVGQRFLEHLTDAAPGRYDIAVLSEEPRAAYDRVQLTSLFSGKTAADLSLMPPDFCASRGISISLSNRAVSIDRAHKRVLSAAGQNLEYDRLVLATGSYPFVPPLPGRDRPDCFVYRTIDDLDAIRSAGLRSRSGVVIGGGLLGLEAAKALKDLGLETNVVEFAPRLMAVQIDDAGGRILRSQIEALGVRVHTGKSTVGIADGTRARHQLTFTDGTQLETDIVVFSAGIRPRDDLARACGLTVGERGGIVVDGACRTSDPDIYAIGECALWNNRSFGLVAPGYRMAEVAAAQMLGRDDTTFDGADMSTKLKLMGVDVASLGDAHAASDGARAYVFVDERKQVYKKLVVNADGTRLLGGVLVGDANDYGSWLQTMLNALPLPPQPEALILPMLEAAPKTAAIGIRGLPATAQICSCNNVSKGALCAAIDGGATTLAGLKKATKAATSCGGCAPLVSQVLKSELAHSGIAVSNHLCEHFPFSRQQLFHLVRTHDIHTFEDLLARHGKGLGCDICKPAAASIFASCWNEFVLAPDKATLQDTNDYYLANMQKDGTYSVIPRIPGGEITPDKLIVIGMIARKFSLYTKITGGQRIDLLGARVHQLPTIWKELIEAGFESGHAYGKAVRTVKSCVGSTWCRYGVQDSVALSIEIENRYKGLRGPHKIKFAVSGCTRECAEAQSKDVGVIATEKGWNLYVCGNGGMKPRHAELLAADLEHDTLIRYIDRFLMFYVRTADRLQRTATWIDNLEGGLDYVKDVVCNDSLAIGAELEADMARIVGTYECEWKKAIDDPATLKRFRHFVNSEAEDDNVKFVEERGQIRPAARRTRERA